MTALTFGVFDHIEHLPDVPPEQLYEERLQQLELFDQHGSYSYHPVEHHTVVTDTAEEAMAIAKPA